MEVRMSTLPEIIAYIWLIPLFLFVILPLSMLVVYLLGRLIHFMLFPKRILDREPIVNMPEAELEKVR